MIFISYRSGLDAASIDKLTDALDRAGVAYWIDRQEIDAGDDIQKRIETGLAQCHALLAWFSADYPRSRACQWEITAALVAARGDATPVHRVLVVNPQATDNHLRPLAVRDIRRLPAPRDASGFDTLAKLIATILGGIPGPLGALRRLGCPPTYGFKPLGSNRFVGRIDDLWRIHDALARGDHAIIAGHPHPATAGQLAQVQGSGGIGKSLLAEEYALRFGAFWPGGIFWLRAFGNPDHPTESPAALAQRRAQEYSRQLVDFADALGIDPKNLDDAQLRRRLGAKLDEKNEHWLWIVDDLPACTRTELESWLAPGRRGQTLITTRNRKQDSVGYLLALDVLPPNDARALLTRDHPPAATEEPAIVSILQRLDGHALALDIARAACRRKGYVNFLRQLENPGADALELAVQLAGELPNGHNPSIAATFLTGFTDLPEEGRDFLRLAAQLAVAPIERMLVAACLVFADTLTTDEAQTRAECGMQQAVERSLAEEQNSGTSGANLLVHTLVSRTLRLHDANKTRQIALRHGAIEILSRVMSQGEDIRKHGALQLAALHAAELATTAATASELRLAARLGSYEHEAARYQAAHHWLQQAVDGFRLVLGDEHPDTLTSMGNLATAMYAQGDLAGALDLETTALEIRQRTLGEEHPDTLTSVSNLASTLKAQGDFTGALALEMSTLEIRRRTLGDEHPDTLTSINNLASTLHDAQGDLTGALNLNKSALEIRRRTLGTEHPDTLTSMNNLASAFRAQGDLAGALDLEKSALEIRRRTLGNEHPNTLTSINNLASTLYAQGDLTGALDLNKSALEIQQHTLGNKHPATLISAWNLFATALRLNDTATVKDMLEKHLQPLRQADPNDLSADLRTIQERLKSLR